MATIDATDKLIPLNKVPDHLPVKVGIPAVRNWVRIGVNGIRLKSKRIAGRRYVRLCDVEEFLSAVEQAAAFQVD